MEHYEMIREIPNCCKNNQMRDVFFEEVDCDDPETYVRSLFGAKEVAVHTQALEDGSLLVYAQDAMVLQKFHFTRIFG